MYVRQGHQLVKMTSSVSQRVNVAAKQLAEQNASMVSWQDVSSWRRQPWEDFVLLVHVDPRNLYQSATTRQANLRGYNATHGKSNAGAWTRSGYRSRAPGETLWTWSIATILENVPRIPVECYAYWVLRLVFKINFEVIKLTFNLFDKNDFSLG